MLRQLRLTYANVVATLALFGVLAGGGAYAASKIGPGDIAKNAVRAKHVKGSQVRAKHIKPSAVKQEQIADAAVGGAKLGPGIPRDVEIRFASSASNSVDKDVSVECPEGKLPIGGGVTAPVGGATGFVAVADNRPMFAQGEPQAPIGPPGVFDSNGWRGRAIEVNGGSTQNWAIGALVICARLPA